MPGTFLHPTLKSLISKDDVPVDTGINPDETSGLLEKIFYRNFHFIKNKSGSRCNYNLEILFYSDIGIDIPGTGLRLILNSNNAGGSAYSVKFSYELKIMSLLRSFYFSGFLATSRAFFDLLLDAIGINENELLKKAIGIFITDPSPVAQWILQYNQSNPSATINPAADPDNDIYIDNIINAFANINVAPFDVIFNQHIANAIAGFAHEKIETLLNKWLGAFSISHIRDLLIPKIEASIDDLNVSLEFPRKLLVPVDTNPGSPGFGNPLPEPAKALLTYHIGT